MAGRGSILKRIPAFLREVRSELRKVVWPTRRETLLFTSVVVVSVAVVAVAIWVIDSTFSQVLRLILR